MICSLLYYHITRLYTMCVFHSRGSQKINAPASWGTDTTQPTQMASQEVRLFRPFFYKFTQSDRRSADTHLWSFKFWTSWQCVKILWFLPPSTFTNSRRVVYVRRSARSDADQWPHLAMTSLMCNPTSMTSLKMYQRDTASFPFCMFFFKLSKPGVSWGSLLKRWSCLFATYYLR